VNTGPVEFPLIASVVPNSIGLYSDESVSVPEGEAVMGGA